MEMQELHHVGMVADDLEAAMSGLGATLCTAWAPVQEAELALWTPQQVINPTLRYTISAAGPPHIELIESAAGTPWAGEASLHHLAFWAEDLARASRDLADAGMPLEVTYHDDDTRPLGFVYHLHPAGTYLEIMDAANRPDFAQWIAAADASGG